jgi:hypothetical protein
MLRHYSCRKQRHHGGSGCCGLEQRRDEHVRKASGSVERCRSEDKYSCVESRVYERVERWWDQDSAELCGAWRLYAILRCSSSGWRQYDHPDQCKPRLSRDDDGKARQQRTTLPGCNSRTCPPFRGRRSAVLWTPSNTLGDLSTDYKARKLNDTIVILVAVQTTAAQSGNSSYQRTFATSSAITGLGGRSYHRPESAVQCQLGDRAQGGRRD